MKSKVAALFTLSLLLTVLPAVASAAAPVPTCRGEEATIIGSPDADVLVGSPDRDVIVGLAGDDTIDGGGGPDIICGNNGDDVLRGRGGRDVLDGGKGNDRLIGGSGRDKLFGGDNADTLLGGGGNDRIKGALGHDTAHGGGGDDRIFGGAGRDMLRGKVGFDTLDGGGDRDTCFGEVELNCEVAARTGGALTLRQWQAPHSLNPYLYFGTKDWLAASLVLEPLAEFTPDGRLVPVLATKLPTVANGGIAADHTWIKWKLVDTVWSDGTPLTASDVAFTYDYCSSLAWGCPSLPSGIASVRATNNRTVKITFDSPTPNPYAAFVGYGAPIIQESQFAGCMGTAAERCAAANSAPIGTGPYMVTEFRAEDWARYAFNPKYRDGAAGKPFFGEVLIRGGGTARASARSVLRLGEADYAWNLTFVDPVTLASMEATGIGTLYTGFTSDVEHINLNQTDPDGTPPSDYSGGANPNPFFFENEVLHDALSMAINRTAIVDVGYGYSGRPTCNMWNAGAQTSTNNDGCLTQDIAGANALLDANGYLDTDEDGVRETPGGLPLEFDFVTSTNAVRQATQDIIESDWAQIGVSVNMTNVDPASFFDRSNDAGIWKFLTDIQMFTNGTGWPDAAGYLGGWTTAEIPESTNNWTGWNFVRLADPQFDALHAQLEAIPLGDPAADALAIQLNDIIVDYSTIPLVHRGSVSAFANTIEGHGDLNGWDSEYWNIEDWMRRR